VIHVFENILSGSVERRAIVLEEQQAPRTPGSSRRAPLITSWARPPRIARQTEECFYLVREDGVLNYVQIADRKGGDSSKAGTLEGNIDQAFASLDIGLKVPDLLLSAGDMSIGGLYSVS
jgi:hypothetical protein